MMRLIAALTLAGTYALAGHFVLAVPAPEAATELIKDRAGFIPQRKYQPLAGKTIGVLVSDVAAVMSQDGRSGPRDAYGFSRDVQSYRWVYVPVAENPLINNLQVRLGDKGDRIKVYPRLSLANAATVQQWQIAAPCSLVEVEVNDGQGAPAEEGFVATRMTRVDGTKAYPFQVAEVIQEMRKKHQRQLDDQQQSIGAALAEAQRKAIKDRKATGPRETSELFYITWLPDTERLRLCFRTRITDGAYQFGGGANLDRPIPLPALPPPIDPKQAPPPPAPQARARIRPPPGNPGVKFGTSFGVELGFAYEVDKQGKLARTLMLPIESFVTELPPPPAVGGPRGGLRPFGPIALPPPPAPRD